MCAEPLTRMFSVGAKALDRQPETPGMIGNSKVNAFVRYQIAQDEIGGHYQPPIEGKVGKCRAVSPLGALGHDVNFSGLAINARQDGFQMGHNGYTRLLAQPVLKAAPCVT